MLSPNPTVENVLGTIGTVLFTIQVVPQIVKSYREKSTHGLSIGLMLIWGISAPIWGVYVVVQHFGIALQIQPHRFGVLCLLSCGQCLYYTYQFSLQKTCLYLVASFILWAGFEVGGIFAFEYAKSQGTDIPIQVLGYVHAVLVIGGLVPQFWEIFRLREVVGISLVFLAIDGLGGVFCTLAMFFRNKLDVAGLVSYALIIVLDGAIILLAFVLNPLAKRKRALGERESAHSSGEAEKDSACC